LGFQKKNSVENSPCGGKPLLAQPTTKGSRHLGYPCRFLAIIALSVYRPD